MILAIDKWRQRDVNLTQFSTRRLIAICHASIHDPVVTIELVEFNGDSSADNSAYSRDIYARSLYA
jgi:hypothetical protein